MFLLAFSGVGLCSYAVYKKIKNKVPPTPFHCFEMPQTLGYLYETPITTAKMVFSFGYLKVKDEWLNYETLNSVLFIFWLSYLRYKTYYVIECFRFRRCPAWISLFMHAMTGWYSTMKLMNIRCRNTAAYPCWTVVLKGKFPNTTTLTFKFFNVLTMSEIITAMQHTISVCYTWTTKRRC